MKISELSTGHAADLLCRMTPHIAGIVSDKALLDALKEKMGDGKHSAAEIYTYGAKKVSEILPIVLNDHRDDLFGILAALNEKTPEEIAGQNVLETMYQVREALNDRELADFFVSWQQGEQRE